MLTKISQAQNINTEGFLLYMESTKVFESNSVKYMKEK